ncbi:Predicted APH family phosphotransferase fused to gluconate kinase family enzyme [Methylacidimicrobium sp. AP8]|uniref:bifunctional aminoglycoside phosphotransferase/ATP-binding protein n=1 Tax=Methylacidimicrobium sp. AP8 TaxID=2730359 RepID=UPI0018C12895|nr:AAA family ATPase [Methylacidimicrobium sp. AP8]CAB4244117.1 Predicted APH family phosphotransferase fused to gluconate kinase family enzyme [Methylacidimicrobium sp. AP8]
MPSHEAPIPPSASPEELLAFLRDPRSYPHHPERVDFLQTHASYVFVVPPYVYKVKKPVNFGFLDYSTLEKRKYFCEQEIALNRELCSEAYLGVIPIVRQRGSLRFGGDGEPVEYAVQMARLAEEFFAKRLLLQGRFGEPELDRIAERLAAFYSGQQPDRATLDWGRVEKLKITSDENFAQTEVDIGRTIDRMTWETLRFFTEEFYRRQAALFERRIREGWIKSGHGDLHLEHIHISPKSLCIYDRIEFNERFRSVDVASDAAFLAMDLTFQGRVDLCCYFLERLARCLDDPDMLKLSDFYCCQRAYVRGKVESMTARDPLVPGEAQEACRRRARRYFALALRFATVGFRPAVLAVMGRIGSGKSTLAGGLGRAIGWPVLASDPIRKGLAGLPLEGRPSAEVRSWLYSPEFSERTYRELLRRAGETLRTEHGCLLDATFARRDDRERLRELCRQAGADLLFLEAQAGENARKQRLSARADRPDVVSDARAEDLAFLDGRYEPPAELADGALLAVPCGADPESSLCEALRALAARKAAARP